jgi:hypothetical protein
MGTMVVQSISKQGYSRETKEHMLRKIWLRKPFPKQRNKGKN